MQSSKTEGRIPLSTGALLLLLQADEEDELDGLSTSVPLSSGGAAGSSAGGLPRAVDGAGWSGCMRWKSLIKSGLKSTGLRPRNILPGPNPPSQPRLTAKTKTGPSSMNWRGRGEVCVWGGGPEDFLGQRLCRHQMDPLNLCDGEGPNELGDLLTNLHPKGQITGGEPDTLADTVGRKGPAMLVDIGSIVVGRLEEGRAGCLLLLQGKEWA